MRLAFIGLGAIGLPIARRLALHPDIELSIFDTRPEVLEAEAGLGRVASSVADAITGAEVIFSVLPADAHVRGVGKEIAAAGAPGQTYLDFSTIAPSSIDAVSARLAAVGVETLGGALTRSVAAAETGDLSIFVGGRETAIERLRPALDQMATQTLVVATPAAAKALKIVNNMVVSSLGLVICEALLVAARHGVGPGHFVEALGRSGADSWPLRNHIAKHLLTGELAPGRFSTRYMGKDAALATQLAMDRGQPAWFAGLVTAAYRGSEALGYGEHYHPIVMRWLEHAAAVEPITPASRDVGPLTPEAAGACEQLCRAVAAQQTLITLDAVRLIAAEGVGAREALEQFEAGSASNDCIRALLSGDHPDGTAVNPSILVADLSRACALASTVSVPAMGFEVGRNVALSMLAERDRGGPTHADYDEHL
jgi:3-hydroxyisobutyrate dehydrogenase-like beta-hydroxyacid dehydrogenase